MSEQVEVEVEPAEVGQPRVEPMSSEEPPGDERPARPRRTREPGDVPVLLDKTDDRWAWRRRIRADPRKARVYRIGVAIAGLLLIILGAATGPLPGPGGIPLVLLGLAVWASEFEWAQRLMQWFKRQLHRFRSWGRGKQALAWVLFFAVIGCIGYAYLLVVGVPVWLPHAVADKLDLLPGV